MGDGGPAASGGAEPPAKAEKPAKAESADAARSAAYGWLELILETSAREVERDGARPTILSRTMAIAVTAMYDAWAAYDDKAVGTRLGGTLRRPPAERTAANKEKAIGYAVYRALIDLYPEDEKWVTGQARARGVDPDNRSTDPATPEGVGNAAAAAVLAYRRHDGANQFGDEVGCDGKPYSDYTYYRPVNSPDKLIDPDCWQPIPFDNGKGGTVVVGFLTPHWYFALHLRHAPLPRLHLRPQHGQRRLRQDAGVVHRQRPLRRDGKAHGRRAH